MRGLPGGRAQRISSSDSSRSWDCTSWAAQVIAASTRTAGSERTGVRRAPSVLASATSALEETFRYGQVGEAGPVGAAAFDLGVEQPGVLVGGHGRCRPYRRQQGRAVGVGQHAHPRLVAERAHREPHRSSGPHHS